MSIVIEIRIKQQEPDEAYIYKQAKEELRRMERARKQRKEMAARSFSRWLSQLIAQVGRALGYRIFVPMYKCRKAWEWLFDGK